MNVLESLWHSFWWLLPLLLMVFCCLAMRGRRGPGGCGFRSWGTASRSIGPADSAIGILDKRFARGEIGREEYEERKRSIRQERSS